MDSRLRGNDRKNTEMTKKIQERQKNAGRAKKYGNGDRETLE
jgi:hypothetical protein